jgi:hypothetical protein
MTWKHGTAKLYSPSKDADETLPALISDDGIAIFGFKERGGRSVFAYKSGDSEFSFLASRFSPDGVLTDTWTVGVATIKRDLESLHGALFARNNIAKVVRDIEDALLTDPAWPSDFGRPDLPARNVQFQDSLP